VASKNGKSAIFAKKSEKEVPDGRKSDLPSEARSGNGRIPAWFAEGCSPINFLLSNGSLLRHAVRALLSNIWQEFSGDSQNGGVRCRKTCPTDFPRPSQKLMARLQSNLEPPNGAVQGMLEGRYRAKDAQLEIRQRHVR
jgi:hypothetical protein